MGGGTGLKCAEVTDDGGMRSGCHEPNNGVNFARRAESSPDSNSSREVHGGVAYGERVVSGAVIEVTSFSTRQEDLTMR